MLPALPNMPLPFTPDTPPIDSCVRVKTLYSIVCDDNCDWRMGINEVIRVEYLNHGAYHSVIYITH